MIWLGLAIGVLALVVLVAALVLRRADDDVADDEVDPLFTMGIALTGAGVALAVTLGAFMYAVMAVGLIVMAIGGYRSNHHHG